jgi:hypothetical protein
MNYEELLESRNGGAMAKEPTVFGQLYKKMVSGKYANVIDLREELRDSLVFCDALAGEAERNKELNHRNQLHFKTATDSAGLYGVTLEAGTYHTFARLLDDNPAVVAGKDFIERTLKDLLDLTSYLHEQGIFHVCYSPYSVLARKGDNTAMLLFHGSAYQLFNDQEMLYGDSAAYVAPEVVEEGTVDARSDIYSIGKFMEYLFQQSEIPVELKGVIKKATDPDPDRRYQTPEEMKSAISRRQNTRRSLLSLAVALVIAALAFYVYFSLTPEREDIEFVKPAPRQPADDLLDDGFDPTTELGLVEDTAAKRLDDKKMREYQAKAEQIFRKNFTAEAERILSKIYNNDQMGTTERNFQAGSQATMEELVKAQVKLGNDAGLTDTRCRVVAGQIVDQVTNKLKAQMKEREKQQE